MNPWMYMLLGRAIRVEVISRRRGGKCVAADFQLYVEVCH